VIVLNLTAEKAPFSRNSSTSSVSYAGGMTRGAFCLTPIAHVFYGFILLFGFRHIISLRRIAKADVQKSKHHHLRRHALAGFPKMHRFHGKEQ